MNTNSIKTDLLSLTLQQSLSSSAYRLNQSMHRLATGSKINFAGDNAANFTLSSNLKVQTSGLSVANDNIKMSLSTLSGLDGYYSQLSEKLQSLRDMAIQASNGIYTSSELNMINTTSSQLISVVNQVASNASQTLPTSEQATGFIKNVSKVSEAQAVSMGYDENHIIRTAADFVTKISANLSGNFILVNDIDMSQLGTFTNSVIMGAFTGKLNGNGCIINKLSINTNASGVFSAGLFRTISGSAEIKNLGMKDLSLLASGSTVTGGMVAESIGGTITNSFATGNVLGGSSVGVLVGRSSGGVYKDVYSKGSVTSDEGGRIGGLIGAITNDSISNSYSEANVQGQAWSAGGLLGQVTDSIINNVNASGTVNGENGVGGLIGTATNTTINNAYASGSVQAPNTAGGLIGQTDSADIISNSYATGSVSGTTYIGGFVGRSATLNLTNSYASGLVTGSSWAGGFIGRQMAGNVGTTNYWDTETSGRLTSSGGAVGVTTAQLTTLKAQGLWSNAGYKPMSGPMVVQTGASASDSYVINDVGVDLDLSGVDLSTMQTARDSIAMIDNAISIVASKRGNVGAGIQILESISTVNNNRMIALREGYSSIHDTDIAEECAELVKQQILQQTTVFLFSNYRNSRSEMLLSLITEAA